MENLEQINIYIDENEIVRLLGYKDKEPGEEILNAIRDEIDECKNCFKPKVFSKEIKIRKFEADRVILENDIIFEGKYIAEKLTNCKYVIVIISTIGNKIDQHIKENFENQDYLKGIIADNIAITALSYINKLFWRNTLRASSDNNIGITSRLSPGDCGFSLEEQKKLFECLGENGGQIVLNEANMMLPVKSTSAVYGLGEGIGLARNEHICGECNLIECAYRAEKDVEITIDREGKKYKFKAVTGSNLLNVLRQKHIFLHSFCGGNGSCGKCKISVAKGKTYPTDFEREKLSEEEIEKGVRLACKTIVQQSMEIDFHNNLEEMSIITSCKEINIKPDAMVIKKYLEIEKPCIQDQRDDCKRIQAAVGISNLVVGYNLLQTISESLREAQFKITACLFQNQLINIESGDTTNKSFGIAADIGTTTIVCYLINLCDGTTIDAQSQVNEQQYFGADVISRISYAINNEGGTKTLKDVILSQINSIIEILCNRNNISPDNIYNMAVTGNTVMLHFFLGLQTKNIALAPFVPVITSGLDLKAEEVGIKIKGYVSILPCISSYAGSDVTAGILSSGMLESEKYSILLDIGTNGEIVLGNNKEIVTCATAAGPAFEGTNISCGVGSINGAINEVCIDEKITYNTINGYKACGICGSGVIDITAELLRNKIIDKAGRMADKDEIPNINLSKRITFVNGIRAFVLENGQEYDEPIVFTQKDISEVQMAKAAIAAGFNVLLKEKKIELNDIEKIFIGGGFGSSMNIYSAIATGIIPKEFWGKINSVSNCAGMGAKLYLLSKENREKAKNIVEKALYVELSSRKEFQDFYIDSMMFC